VKKVFLILAVISLAILLVAGYSAFRPRPTPEGQPPLLYLSSETLLDFQKQFNDSAGGVRVLLLLSPT